MSDIADRTFDGVTRWSLIVAPLVLAAIVISVALRPPAYVKGAPLLRPPPSIAGTDLRGKHVSLGSMRGSPLVVIFFASWCGPCHEDALIFTGLAERYRHQVGFISVAVDDASRRVRAFATRYGWSWSVVPDDERRWVGAFGPFGLPATFVIDRDGAVIRTLSGPVTKEQLGSALDPLVPSSQMVDPTGGWTPARNVS